MRQHWGPFVEWLKGNQCIELVLKQYIKVHEVRWEFLGQPSERLAFPRRLEATRVSRGPWVPEDSLKDPRRVIWCVFTAWHGTFRMSQDRSWLEGSSLHNKYGGGQRPFRDNVSCRLPKSFLSTCMTCMMCMSHVNGVVESLELVHGLSATHQLVVWLLLNTTNRRLV